MSLCIYLRSSYLLANQFAWIEVLKCVNLQVYDSCTWAPSRGGGDWAVPWGSTWASASNWHTLDLLYRKKLMVLLWRPHSMSVSHYLQCCRFTCMWNRIRIEDCLGVIIRCFLSSLPGIIVMVGLAEFIWRWPWTKILMMKNLRGSSACNLEEFCLKFHDQLHMHKVFEWSII